MAQLGPVFGLAHEPTGLEQMQTSQLQKNEASVRGVQSPLSLRKPMLIDVLVDLPIAGNKTYTYRVPEAITLSVGAVVAVPFGPRVVHGFCTRIREAGCETVKPAMCWN